MFESKYYEAAGKAQKIIDAGTRPQNAAPQEEADIQYNDQLQQVRRKPKLPEIKLPEFNGEYSKWIFYKNNFEATIHNDNDLTAVQKHQYLIGTLQGEARKVIEGFTISEENYENAWTLLKNTYDNQMVIIDTHLEELLNFPSITKENKAESMRQLIWHIQTHIASLKILSQPVEYWDTVIIHMAKKKLDFIEQKDWQDRIKACTPQNMPKLKDFVKYLTERSHTIRMLQQSKGKTVNVKQPQDSRKTDKKVVLASMHKVCKLCKKEHPIFNCEELLKLSPDERRKVITERKLCANCLYPGHFAKYCRGSHCRKCGGRHNTLLHRDDVAKQTDDQSPSTSVAVNHCIRTGNINTSVYLSGNQ